MSENTKIEWTDATFNGWLGCSKVHTGCAHCYAEADQDKRRGRVKWGPHGTRSRTSDANWRKPLTWNRKAEQAGRRMRVFASSLCDVFEDWDGPIVDHRGRLGRWHGNAGGPFMSWRLSSNGDRNWNRRSPVTMDDLRRELFSLIDQTPWLDWLLLTKRPENVRRMWPRTEVDVEDNEGIAHPAKFRENVKLGTSISDQETADKQIPELLECHDLCAGLFLSCEPLLGPIDLTRVQWHHGGTENVLDSRVSDVAIRAGIDRLNGIDWVIVGGESGPNARPCEVRWIRAIRDQCRAAGVPVFVKQLGSNVQDMRATSADREPDDECWPMDRIRGADGQHILLHDKKGGDWSEWPNDLRVRKFPQAAVAAE